MTRLLAVALGAAACAMSSAAWAEDPYVVGVAGAVTGPAAGSQAPVVEMMRIYVDRLNAKGGVNGHPIKLIIEDDRTEPSRAAANAIKLLRQDNVGLLVETSFSTTYGPVIAEATRANVPLLFAGSVCPPETHPPAKPLLFCSTSFDFGNDIPNAIQSIRDASKAGSINFAVVTMSAALGRIGADLAKKKGEELDMKLVGEEFVPPTTTDYTPFATKIKAEDPTWVFAYAPWITQVKTFEALRRLGWNGTYLAAGLVQAEDDLTRIKDPGFEVLSANAMFGDELPVQKEIREAAEQGKFSYPLTYATEGWISGMVLETILTKVGWPMTTEKLLAVMNSFEMDTKGLRGGPLTWTNDNHFRPRTYYRVYGWSNAKQAVTRASEWRPVDVTK